MDAINITAYTQDPAQIEAVKAMLKAFKIKFKITKQKDEAPNYSPAFVEKIKKSQKEYQDKNFITVKPEDLKSFLGLDEI